MAVVDIVAQVGDKQDFVLEVPTGNAGYVPNDIIIESDGVLLCSEIPEAAGGGNIFIMSE